MPNTPANDSPYVIGAIEDAATAEYPGLTGAITQSGFGGDTLNPVVVNEDGSFLAAFQVTAPSYQHSFNLTIASGTATLTSGGATPSEYHLFNVTAATPGSLRYFLDGRNPSTGQVVSVEVFAEGRTIRISDENLAGFEQGVYPNLRVTGIQPGTTFTGVQIVEAGTTYDPAATVEVPVIPVNPTVLSGTMPFFTSGSVEAFEIENAAVWTTPSTIFRIQIVTQEPLDLTGVTAESNTGTVGTGNSNLTGLNYSTVITVPLVDGKIAVPETVLQQLQVKPGAVAALLVVNGVTGAVPTVNAVVRTPVTQVEEGLYVQAFDASGNPTGEAVRVDDAVNLSMSGDEEKPFIMSKAADGSVLLAWLGDEVPDSDGEAGTIYVRVLDTSGVPQGDRITLTGADPALIRAIEAIEEDDFSEGALDIARLADGGYAVAFNAQVDEFAAISSGVTFTNQASFSLPFGQLDRIDLFQFTAPGALTARLEGNAPDGSFLSVPVTLANNSFQMTDALADQFAPGSHLLLRVIGLTPGTQYAASITSKAIFDFDATSALSTINFAGQAAPNPIGVPDAFISTNAGQTISYQINSITPSATETPAYTLSIFTSVPVDVSGLTLYTGTFVLNGVVAQGANTFVNGYYLTSLVVTPVAGVVDIPATVLAQIDGDGIGSVLMISGLQGGTPVNVAITTRQPTAILEEGIFIQQFDAAGAAEGPAQRIDDSDGSLAVSATPGDDDVALGVEADADGGFHVSWISDTDIESVIPRIINREFDADGNPVGTATDISAGDIPGVVDVVLAGGEVIVPPHAGFVELSGGGFAGLLQVEANTIQTTINTTAPSSPLLIRTAQGLLDEVVIFNQTASETGVRYFAVGTGTSGSPVSVEVFANGGEVVIPEDVQTQFAPGTSIALQVTGLAPGSSFGATAITKDIWNFAPDAPTATTSFSTNFVAANVTVAFAPGGLATDFQITSATAAGGQVAQYALLVFTANPVGLESIGFNPQSFNPASGLWTGFIPVLADGTGHISVPPALLALVEDTGAAILLAPAGLQPGSTFSVDITARQPSGTVEEGLFVQLFDAAGTPTGEFIRVDDAANPVFSDEEDFSVSSIQADASGGFTVVWAADTDGGDDADALVIRRFDAEGNALGDPVAVDSIPDRVYDEGEAVTLYTAGLFADPDPNDVLTFSAAGLPAGLAIDPATGVISGEASEGGLFAVTVTATDAGGLSASTSFEIFIVGDGGTDVNTGPTAITLANSITETPENGGPVKVADIVVEDDGLGVNTLALVGADAGSFFIADGASGPELFFIGNADFEAKTYYDVSVTATDSSLGVSVSQALRLSILDVAESQIFIGTNDDDYIDLSHSGSEGWLVEAGKGNDSIFAGIGDDIVNGESGDDTLSAGAGDDQFLGGAGNDFGRGDEGDDTLDGEGGDDQLLGDEGDDTITGGAGVDDLDGGYGNDTIDAGSGDDSVDGGYGDDIIEGGTGNDWLFGSFGIDRITGGTGHDNIQGDSGTDSLWGGSGDDVISGGANADMIYGEAGNDELLGGDGADTVDGGSGMDFILGGTGADNLNGGDGNDTLLGGSGNDILNGSLGTDLLTGGQGGDTFVFNAKADSKLGALADRITDFSLAQGDLIDLSLIDANTKLADDQAFTWIGSGAFSKSAGQLRYEVVSGNTHITGDMNGDAKADFEIVLEGVTSLPGTSEFLIL